MTDNIDYTLAMDIYKDLQEARKMLGEGAKDCRNSLRIMDMQKWADRFDRLDDNELIFELVLLKSMQNTRYLTASIVDLLKNRKAIFENDVLKDL